MTFEPVLPPLVLAFAALALVTLRLLSLRPAYTSGRQALLRWCLTTAAMVLVLLAAARPVTGTVAEPAPAQTSQTGANVYFLVDRSADSAITDFDGAPRMSGMRDDIEAVIDAHPGARFAVISFAARPAIDWPLSADAWSLTPVVEALNPYPGADSTEVNAAAAANVLRYQLISAGQQFPQARNLVYYLGSGAGQSTVPQGVFDTPAVDGGAVLGYGAGPGENTLRDIAGQLGLPFIERARGEALPRGDSSSDQAAPADPADVPERSELYWVLTMLASLLLLPEIYLTARDLRKARATRKEVLP
ncbi:VWA domain-containing protein [Mycolicibacterium sp. BiH015]|uniref:vWA domain-containing protein n=1 Tax=Mycolicibacterium sp. BiH015 TaxID=3018808 RepID=UPI0022E21F90|nr:VWA domain-containing protein [Mycolicibacterium sp. BiH015]MDA2891786.1 VWA domain-containing protein [Mycolicibacterium sp. BiH015]